MIVAQGNVDDNPFARTVFSLAANQFTGDLVLTKSRREYRLSWENGQVVAAASPSPADTPGRVALANGLVNSTTLGIIVQHISEEPDRDPCEIIAEIANLTSEQMVGLKHRVLARRAARIFALPGAEFVVDNARTMRADAQLPPLDVRWLIYFGLRTHYTLERLSKELAAVGDRGINLPPQALPMIPAFGFTGVEAPILKRLQAHTLSIANLVDATREVDEATTTCLVYALMASGYLTYGESQAPRNPKITNVPAAEANLARGKPPRLASPGTAQGIGFVGKTKGMAKGPEAIAARKLIKDKLALLEQDASHYRLIGLTDTAPAAEIRSHYFELARQLHPDHLQSIGITDMAKDVQRLFAAINKAFAVLSNPKERSRYREIMSAGGEKAYARKRKQAEDLALKALRAEEHYNLGEMALRRDAFSQAAKEFKQATDLAPNESEYLALYAWAFLCSAENRNTAIPEAEQMMKRARRGAPKNSTVTLYFAKLLKLIGRKDEAIRAFKKLLQIDPENHEAQLELRVLKQS